MYIRYLVVRDVKLLRDVTINFLRDGRPRMWTVLLGENGLSKTTILALGCRSPRAALVPINSCQLSVRKTSFRTTDNRQLTTANHRSLLVLLVVSAGSLPSFQGPASFW